MPRLVFRLLLLALGLTMLVAMVSAQRCTSWTLSSPFLSFNYTGIITSQYLCFYSQIQRLLFAP